jgi:transcriptional regulator with XRE-family HTH domain
MIGSTVRMLRLRNRFKLFELANAAGISSSYLCKLEKGTVPMRPKHVEMIQCGLKRLGIEA